MISIQTLRSFVNERLSAAAEEICMVVERIITDYEDEALRSKQQIDNFTVKIQDGKIVTVLDKGSEAHIKLHQTDIPEQPQRIIKTCEEESSDDDDDDGGGGDDDDDEDVLEFPASGITKQQQIIVQIFEEENDNDDDFPGFPASELSSEGQERSPSLVREEPEFPRVKEEQEELVLSEMADVSTMTTLDRKPHLDTLSAVTNLPDAISTAKTFGWPTDLTSAEPEQQLDMCSDPGMERLAECLVGLRAEPSKILTAQQANTIIALWQNVPPMPYDRSQVASSPLEQAARWMGRWPDCCHLVESILVKLCDIHKNPMKYQACYTLRWTPVLREYQKIRQLVCDNRTVMESTNLQLLPIDQKTFIDWHGLRMQRQDCSILLQGVSLQGVSSDCSILVQGVNSHLPPVQVDPTGSPQPGLPIQYHSAQSTAELAMDTSESAASVEHTHPSQSDSQTLTAEMLSAPQQSPPPTSGPRPLFMMPQIPAQSYSEWLYARCRECSQPHRTSGHIEYLGSVYCPQKADQPFDQWKEDLDWKSLKHKKIKIN